MFKYALTINKELSPNRIEHTLIDERRVKNHVEESDEWNKTTEQAFTQKK